MKAMWGTITAAAAEARANRAALWTQVLAMVVNDVAWVAFWTIFFHRVGTVRGWDTSRVLLLLAILTTSAGLVLGVLANARRVGRLAADGELDAALALPVSPLAYVLLRRIDTVNLGDFVFGIGLFFAACSPTPARFALYVVGSLTSAALFTGFLVAVGSIAFFAGTGEVGDFGLNAMSALAPYPVDIVAGAPKVLFSQRRACRVHRCSARGPCRVVLAREGPRLPRGRGRVRVHGLGDLHPRPPPLHLGRPMDPRLIRQERFDSVPVVFSDLLVGRSPSDGPCRRRTAMVASSA